MQLSMKLVVLHSEFLIDCFFLEGFEMTLIFLLLNMPISSELV